MGCFHASVESLPPRHKPHASMTVGVSQYSFCIYDELTVKIDRLTSLFFSLGTSCLVRKASATIVSPQAIMLCNLLIFQQTRNKIRSHDALFDHNKLNLPRNFAVNLAGIYIKFDSSAPCVLVQKTPQKRLLRRLSILYGLLCLTACLQGVCLIYTTLTSVIDHQIREINKRMNFQSSCSTPKWLLSPGMSETSCCHGTMNACSNHVVAIILCDGRFVGIAAGSDLNENRRGSNHKSMLANQTLEDTTEL